ncbi:hypothetical protein WN51_07474 [Melipona quadrifasciata]|uniref:Uncharacterized protein n=1 Tax=Melipona quadrifasciata TaxID=166423 RepID=A0A0M9A9D1_9HYME|nr:hypothetical protein WN51_07474 [Melipona quadrifasciata]
MVELGQDNRAAKVARKPAASRGWGVWVGEQKHSTNTIIPNVVRDGTRGLKRIEEIAAASLTSSKRRHPRNIEKHENHDGATLHASQLPRQQQQQPLERPARRGKPAGNGEKGFLRLEGSSTDMADHKQGDGKGETLAVANSNKNNQYVDCCLGYARPSSIRLPVSRLRFNDSQSIQSLQRTTDYRLPITPKNDLLRWPSGEVQQGNRASLFSPTVGPLNTFRLTGIIAGIATLSSKQTRLLLKLFNKYNTDFNDIKNTTIPKSRTMPYLKKLKERNRPRSRFFHQNLAELERRKRLATERHGNAYKYANVSRMIILRPLTWRKVALGCLESKGAATTEAFKPRHGKFPH